ncbi:DciA family protein [Streptomyces sp. NPDC088170]|uniref:DciA family protein n=1 Tax=Streptomyces sp. NPDC088170 TaxID=3365834 RepID=UPI00382CDAC9
MPWPGWSRSAAGPHRSVASHRPELAGKVEAVQFDAATGALHLRPAGPAYRAQLNLHQKQIIAKVNDAVGPGTVRHLEILRPAAPAAPSEARTPAPAATPQPMAAPRQTARKEAPEGYREAIAAHRATWTSRQHTDPKIQAAAERQLHERIWEPEDTSPTAARPSRSSAPKQPPSSGSGRATYHGRGPCNAWPPNASGCHHHPGGGRTPAAGPYGVRSGFDSRAVCCRRSRILARCSISRSGEHGRKPSRTGRNRPSSGCDLTPPSRAPRLGLDACTSATGSCRLRPRWSARRVQPVLGGCLFPVPQRLGRHA